MKTVQFLTERKRQRFGAGPCDSDWGVIARRRRHLLRHSSTLRNVIGLSSAESEYYALTEGGCSRLGLQSFFADWNLKLQLSLHAKTVDKNPKEVKKPNTVKFAVDPEQVAGFKNCEDQEQVEECKIAMDAHYGLNSKSVENCEWTNSGTRI